MSLTRIDMPDARGHFGRFGGQFVPETLMPALEELTAAYEQARQEAAFDDEFRYYLKQYVGRPSPLYLAERLTRHLGGARIYLKREDLNHTGAHKINNTIGQALLAKRMGKSRLIAETGAGQHGVATATVAAMFNMQCVVYMGEEDIRRQELNVFRMRLLGAEVIAGDERQQDLEGRHERGDPGLGDQRPHHLLPDRHRRGAASLSHAGAGLSVGDRSRSEAAQILEQEGVCRTASWPAWAAAATP